MLAEDSARKRSTLLHDVRRGHHPSATSMKQAQATVSPRRVLTTAGAQKGTWMFLYRPLLLLRRLHNLQVCARGPPACCTLPTLHLGLAQCGFW